MSESLQRTSRMVGNAGFEPATSATPIVRLALLGDYGARVNAYWWSHLDSNQGPYGCEPYALTN